MPEDEFKLKPGDKVGKYTILEEVSADLLGDYYLAHDPSLERKVTIRTVPCERDIYGILATKKHLEERIRLAGKVLAGLDHPNIVTVYDMGEHAGHLYLALEYVEGRSLKDFDMSRGEISLLVLLRVIMKIAGGLQHMHDRGIVHRDLKPHRIIVSPSGEPVLTNFWVAVPPSYDTSSEKRPRGTPGLMSPEQARGEALTPRTDVFGLGATLFMVISGHSPHYDSQRDDLERTDPEALEEFYERVRSPEPIDLSPLEGKAPEYVIQIIARCLEKDPDKRYPSARDLEGALQAAVRQLEVSKEETAILELPRKGQTVLLRVEHQEGQTTGSFREYDILAHIGGGTYGDVYRAKDRLSGKVIALKVLRSEWVSDQEAVTRFRREAELLSRLRHPSIVTVHNYGRYGTSFFIAMECIEGMSFEDLIKDKAPMDAEQMLELIRPVLDGLSAIHKTGIVHRDLKPSNIKVRGDSPVIFDFGLSFGKDMSKLTRSGLFVGTPRYAAPEQARGEKATASSDIYALGVVIYEMLTAKQPHEADSARGLLRKLASEPPSPITTYRDDLPTNLVDALSQMLAQDPALRPTAAQVLSMLS